MAAPHCKEAQFRQILGKGDTIHDFCDRDRIRDKLNYGVEQKIISSSIDTTSVANAICRKIESLLYIDTCGIPSYNENDLLKFFYGEKATIPITSSEETIKINYYFPNSPKEHIEYQISYVDVPSFIEKINATSSAKYVMDYTYLSPFLCGLGINTIGKAYDRTTINEGDECNQKVTMEPQSVLKKEEGELFFFDEIYTTRNDMELQWKVGSIFGIIDIRKMMEVKSGIGLENLTTAIIAFYQAIQTTPGALLFKSNNDIIKDCYGLDFNQFSDINEYLLALTDLKRMGDLLQVKLAKLLNYTFVSNDRMAILLSTIGYNNPSIRTSKTPSGGERSDRIVALYYFNKTEMESKLNTYNENAIKSYADYIEYLGIITKNIRDDKSVVQGNISYVNQLYAMCQQILDILLPFTTLNPLISKTDILVPTITGQRIPRHYNPQWLNKDIIIRRGLYVYIQYISIVLKVLLTVSSVGFPELFTQTFNTIKDDKTITSAVILNKIKDLFSKTNIPHPNTLFKTVNGDNIQSSLYNMYTFINSIYHSLNDTNEIEKLMDKDLPMPLFGEPIEYYKKLTVKMFKDIKNTNLSVNINDVYYQIGASSNPEKIIESIVDLEKYFMELIAPYKSQQGGRRKKNSKLKGGEKITLDSLPDDMIDKTLAKLVVAIYETESQGQIDVAQSLFVLYMQLQLITQQFNLSLPIIRESTTEEIAISNQKIAQLLQTIEKPIAKSIDIPRSYSMNPMMVPIAAAAGGKKKSKTK